VIHARVLVITGAGVSAESGIPTFRGKDGYWRNLDPAKLATPEAFARDPSLVWDWYRARRQHIRKAQPNPAHQAIVKLAAQAGEFLLLTQNVDDLHLRAEWDRKRLPRGKIVQIHGDIFVTRCPRCDFQFYDSDGGGSPELPASGAIHTKDGRLRSVAPTWPGDTRQDYDDRELPKCPKCSALMRPGVVWFGEQLDLAKIATVEKFLNGGDCDSVIVAGTTALFGYIIDWALRARGHAGQLIEVNPEETSLSQFATKSFREPAGVALPRLVNELLSNVNRRAPTHRSHAGSVPPTARPRL
jgi:NAD-dependent SIR2 family protein deacetylase